MSKSQRIVRAIALILIVLHHFSTSFAQYSVTGFSFYHANGDFGAVGVDVFWLLSGAVLITNYQDDFSLKRYFKKRFLAILPLYWVSWLACNLYYVFSTEMEPFGKMNPTLLPLTVLGLDGYLNSVGPTYVLVGEWFTGVLVIIYVLFPLLRYLYLHYFRPATFVISSISNIKCCLLRIDTLALVQGFSCFGSAWRAKNIEIGFYR